MKVKISDYPSRLTSSVFNDYMNKRYGYADWPTEYSRFERCLAVIKQIGNLTKVLQ